MIWQELYPEGSIAIINGERFDVKHNAHGLGIDLHCPSDRTLAMTIAPQDVPRVIDSIRYPE